MEKIINMMVAAYIEVLGAEKWNSLTDEQKHDAVMIMVKDCNKALEQGA